MPVNKPVATSPTPPVVVEKAPAGAPAVPEAVRVAEPIEAVPERGRARMQKAIAEQVGRYLQTSERNLEFQVDGGSAMPVIIVRDGEGNVVRRIPGEAALQVLRLANAQSGTFVDSTA